MGYKANTVSGEFPVSGAIFMSNIGTKKECFRQQLFGLPLAMSDFVLHVKKGMTLFLFEFERRELHGVFRATSNGEINMEPDAFRSTGKNFPAQVRFTRMLNCRPLAEHEFKDAIGDNYFSAKKFNFGLSKDQVRRLIMLFQTKRIPKKHRARNSWRYDKNPSEGDGRFDDLRKKLVRDRLGLVSKEDDYDHDTCEFAGDDIKEIDVHVHLNGNFKENVNSSCSRGQHNQTDMVERAQKDIGDKFLTNYTMHSDEFDDCDTRRAILEKHFDHSLGGLRRVDNAGLHSRDGLNDGYDVHNNLQEIRGIKGKHDIEDSYRKIFTEPHGKHFGEYCVTSNDTNKDLTDGNSIQDEYHAIEGFRQSLLEHDLGSPRDRGSRTINDGWFFGHEPVESELRSFSEHSSSKPKVSPDIWIGHNYDEDCSFRSRTSTEHPTFEPRGTSFGIKPDYNEKLGFTSVAPPYKHDSIRGIGLLNNISFSDSMQDTSKSAGNPISEPSEQLQQAYDRGLPYSTSRNTTMTKMPIPYDPDLPDIPLGSSSHFSAGPSSSPVDDSPFYSSFQEIPTSLSRSKTLPYHLQNVGSMWHFDDPGYALLSKSDHTISSHETRDNHIVKGNRGQKISSREGSQSPFFPRFASPTAVETAENVTKGHSSHDFTSTMSPFSAYDNRYSEPRSKYTRKVSEPSYVFKKFSSFDAGLRLCEEDPILPNKFCRPHEKKHLEGTDKRVSVFSRLTSDSEARRHEQEHNTDEKHDLDSSVNRVMKMLEKVVSSPIKLTGKSTIAMEQDEYTTAGKIIDFELPKVMTEHAADLIDEAEEGGSIVQEETRLVDFKRRKKARIDLDDKCKEKFAGPVEWETPADAATEDLADADSNHLMGMTCKRRKLVRPVFVRSESANAANTTDMQPTSHEVITPLKDDDKVTKAVKSSEKAEHLPARCEESVNEGEECSEVEGKEKVENFIFVEGRDLREEKFAAYAPAASEGNHEMCGWIEW